MRTPLIGVTAIAIAALWTTDARAQVCSWAQYSQTGSSNQSCSGFDLANKRTTHTRTYSIWGHLVCPAGEPSQNFGYISAQSIGSGACGTYWVPNPQCPPVFNTPDAGINYWEQRIDHKAWSYTFSWCTGDGSTYHQQNVSTKGCYDYPCPSCSANGVPCNHESQCCSWFCRTPEWECDDESPILINLANNSTNYHLTAAADGVLFDIDADGDMEKISWTEANSDIAFLVLDRNGNGLIDNGTELFGNETPLIGGGKASHGFDALLDLDGGPSSDGHIDSTDAHYDSLRLWLDRNHNGVSESSELITLANAGVTTIFTTYRETPRVDRYGHEYRYLGLALVKKDDREQRRRIFDVFLKIHPN